MSNDVRLDTFPRTKTEALTMLFLQNQDLSGKSPKEIADLYTSVIGEIREAFRNQTPRPSVKFKGI
ncbi:hypothetical protein [Heyndrickxia acidiproducens]|uniref:hypothetical protein n=1 Tax=Heyndrickxia acidiproducens TaxID=1121084 RepID=UPI00037F0ADC|nr:hypothetical protein [Heyndrickxia acidiproducens]